MLNFLFHSDMLLVYKLSVCPSQFTRHNSAKMATLKITQTMGHFIFG